MTLTKELFNDFLRLAGLPYELPEMLTEFAGPAPRLTAEEITRYTNLIVGVKNFTNSIGPVAADAASIAGLYRRLEEKSGSIKKNFTPVPNL